MLLSFLCVPRYALYRYRCFPVSTHADTHSTELPYSQTWELLWVAWQVGFWHAMCFREIKSRLSERHRNLAFCLLILLELEMWGKPPRLAWAYSSGYSHLSEETWDPFWNSFSCPQSQRWGLVLSQGTTQSPSLSVIRIIMLVLNPEETIWRTRQEKLCGLNPSLIQDTKWFKTSLGAKECIGVLVALATCLLAGMREDSEGWKELLFFPRPQDSLRPQVRMGTTLSRWTDMCTTLWKYCCKSELLALLSCLDQD